MRPIKWKKLTIVSLLIGVCIIYYIHSHRVPVRSWVIDKVSEFAWEKLHCKGVERWNSSSKWPPVEEVSSILRIKDKQSVFVNGLGCGEWVDGLQSLFPSLRLTGVDANFGSVHYVRKIVNGSFHARQAYDLLDIPFEDEKGFDHAISDHALGLLEKELQCDAVKRMLPLLKPGGSMFIGQNIEKCDNAMEEISSKISVSILPQCFWSRGCLAGRTDIAEINYIKEGSLFNSAHINPLLKDCTSSVLIYKHIMINKQKDKKPLHPNLDSHGKIDPHPCTKSDYSSPQKVNEKVKEGIKKAIKDMKLRGLDMH